ncbi:sensor histidine kinase [Staphylococcus simiae]|uniref:sensor histidine kinase n=1 Tax=Staphylococcus simiae TaxID=308354 RepID=UPI001A969E9F|nr:sensor histidine kinase [Staphylococcus simiae]MBO1199945.1 sensor histidine kinase [Staphylococcus simiae]MBO1202202.1 sensor histidine kinase [Staphylococcus simiae]MBO1204460.1 sensor histidine kinase [Staphylococcus simiae]MBO1212000.1 sensor histidine kinase [Staphylococcus simiae]MBO1230650.1 sensor histidine kinase [Staphylococcus simiae]
MQQKVKVSLGELSSLIYLFFPFIGIFVSTIRGPKWLYVCIVLIFTVSYVLLVIFYKNLSQNILFNMLVIHYLAIIYFVYSFQPMISLFFFFSAFALPFTLKVTVKSKEFMMCVTTMVICLTITYLFDSNMIISMLIFYVVITLIMLGNFKVVAERQLKSEIEQKNEYINVLIAEQERHRIGQDLHDTLGHVFASLSLKSELAYKLADSNIEATKVELLAINDLSKDSLMKVREIISNLKYQSFEDEIVAVEKILQDTGIQFFFEHGQLANALNPTKQSILSMILREAINNVIKHSGANNVYGSLIQRNTMLIFTIQDNGQGINGDVEPTELTSIYQRVEQLEGKLHIDNVQGTQLTISIPLGGVA